MNDIDMSKPFAIMVRDENGEFGVACGDDGSMHVRKSINDFVKERKQTMDEYRGRGGTWASSATMFGMSIAFKAIVIPNLETLEKLLGEGPFTKMQFGGVAGRACYIKADRKMFEEYLEQFVDIGM